MQRPRKHNEMKRLTNILSYLWLLLLMAVTACSDMEDETGPMQMEEEVELTIHTELSGMKGSTRTAPTESIIAITAYAFDSNSLLIKEVNAKLSDTQATSGTLKIKVPKRTGDIHFVAKNNAKTPDVTINIGDNVSTLLSQTTTELHYWGKATYNGSNNLSTTLDLYRNMATIVLNSNVDATNDYIAGFLNYNTSGTVVPGSFTIGTQNILNEVETASHDGTNESLGTEHYLFEHANSGGNLYAICNIGGLYYKVAFATNSNGVLSHFPIVRNHKYNITINEIETALGSTFYADAIDRDPINNAVVKEAILTITANSTELYYNNNKEVTVRATVPEGVSALSITAENFTVKATSGNVTKTNDYNYTVNSSGDVDFTFTLKDGTYTDNQTVTIQFAGTPKYGYEVTDPEAISITLKQANTVNIEVEPSATTLNYADSSVEDLLVNVTIPSEVTGLSFTSDYFTIKVASGELVAVENEENSYTITHDENATATTVPVRIRLNDNVSAGTASFAFSGTSNDANVIVGDAVTTSITLSSSDDANVRWQGSVPLNENELATIVPLMYDWFLDGDDFISAGSKLNLEFMVTGGNGSTLQVFEICGDTEDDWNNPIHQFAELNNSNKYTATGDGNQTLSLTLSEATFTTISQNYGTDFLGETGDENKIALAIRGTDITLTKVSVVPAEVTPTSNILVTAPDATEGVSEASVDISYSNSSAIEEYTITVIVPDGVTQLNYSNNGFSNVYIDNNGWYNDAQSPINITDTKSIPLRLRVNKDYNSNPTITFSANNVESATFTVNRTAGTTNSDVLWEGALLFQGYDVHVSKIDIPNSSLQGKLLEGAVLTLEYDVVDGSNDFISLYGSGVSNWANLENMADAGEYTDNKTSTITLTLNAAIIENIGNSSLNMQGRGRVLKKVTLTVPTNVTFDVLEETISLDLATNEAVLHVQKPANVTQLTIADNDNLFSTVSTTFANANVDGKTIINLPDYAATIPVKLEITQVVDIKNYTITVAGNDGSSDNVTVELLTTWSGSHSLGNWDGYWRTARKLPVGTTVQITFADYDNCSFELHTYSATDNGNDIRFEAYSVDNDEYILSSNLINGVFSFTVATDGSVQIRNNGNFNNVTDSGLDGLQINGGNGLSVTQVNVTLGSGGTTTEEPLIDIDFSGEHSVYGWSTTHEGVEVTRATIGVEDGTLKLTNEHVDTTNGVQASLSQAAIDVAFENGVTYTLTFRIRADVTFANNNDGLSSEIPIAFQDDVEGSWPHCGDFKTTEYKNAQLSTEWTTVTLTATATQTPQKGRIIFSFGHLVGSIYIDDIKLVKND